MKSSRFPHEGPFYLAVSISALPGGEQEARLLTIPEGGQRLRAESLGIWDRACGHTHCLLMHLGATALRHAEELAVEFHGRDGDAWEQLELDLHL
jgi:hypothetical protein